MRWPGSCWGMPYPSSQAIPRNENRTEGLPSGWYVELSAGVKGEQPADYPRTVIRRGFTASTFGKCSVRTPFFNSA